MSADTTHFGLLEFPVSERSDHQIADIAVNRLHAGFHRALGLSVEEYLRQLRRAAEDLESVNDSQGHIPALVEPRIPLAQQLESLGVQTDPSIWRYPAPMPEMYPYGVWLKRLPNDLAQNPFGMTKLVPQGEELASAYEAVGSDMQRLTADGFSAVGDLIETGSSKLCFDRWFGEPRVTRIPWDRRDSLIGLLVKKT